MIITFLKLYYPELEINTLFFCGPTEFCQLPKDEGEGPAFEFYLFYDGDTDRCTPFLYKGQGGNKNRFTKEIDCIRNCSSNSEQFYPRDGRVIINICISVWLLGCHLGTLEQAVTKMGYDL